MTTRAQRKRTTKKTPKRTTKQRAPRAKSNGKGPVFVDGYLHLSPFDLARYELAQGKVANTAQAIALKKHEADEETRNYKARMQQKANEMAQLAQTLKVVEDELRAMQTELQAAYGLDFSKVAYDDQSGKLTVLDEGPILKADWKPPK